jgi:phage/plasmid-like protein (TIGR03299 family)
MENFNERVFSVLEKTGLNWTVQTKPLFSAEGQATGSQGIFRNDNGLWLGTVGGRYRAYQNYQMAESLMRASDAMGLDMARGGVLGDGKKVYLQMELPEDKIGKSTIKRYVTGLNSHDGTTSIGFGSSNTVVVCQNTFFRAYGEVQKVRHTITAQSSINDIIAQMQDAIREEAALMATFKRMADMPLQDEIVERVMRKLFVVNPDDLQTEVSTRKKNQLRTFADAVKTSVNEQGSTVWALFNGVTRYSTHTLKHELISPFASLGFAEIAKWVEDNTAELVPVSL